ncbi:cobaltochelatase subunit CobN [Paenibacillus sp. MDMC362]|uniref:cobaltochelatase subunit CobN n=1 Tax=Paenibacillus sp. MDMC362 TaxID=2977365 RepID=UPI000DC3BA5D|nr:cobaltochelatase subunit CobN [Paenibacillus sp. MDMC362]RAR42248.1 magnesium chelatase [Paenibacillus sp. MDMC362]
MKITVLTTSHAAMKDLSFIYKKKWDASLRSRLSLSVFNIEGTLSEAQWSWLETAVNQADFIIHDPHGSPARTVSRIHDLCIGLAAEQVIVGGEGERLKDLYRLGSLRYHDLAGAGHRGHPSATSSGHSSASSISTEQQDNLKHHRTLVAYWRNAGILNLHHMLSYIATCFGKETDWPPVEPPFALKSLSIYDPSDSHSFESVEAYWASMPAREDYPTVAILFMGHSYPLHTGDIVSSMMQRIREFANVLPVVFASLSDVEPNRLRTLLMHGGVHGGRVDLIVNFVPFRLGAGPTGGNSDEILALLNEVDAPMFHPFFLTRRERQEWESSRQGLTSSEFLVQMMLPELDGSIEMHPVAALSSLGYDEDMRLDAKELRMIEDRAQRVVGRVKRYLNLRSKKQSEKRIAIIGYNYPPGEGQLFQASFLDTFESMSRILTAMKAHGYDTETYSGFELKERFTQGGVINSAVWSNDHWPDHLPTYKNTSYEQSNQVFNKRKKELVQQWGEAPGDIMTTVKGDFKIPGLRIGNLFIGIQPSRGVHEHPVAAYHDKSLLPHHQYLAFYQYLRDEFKADAILHVGTHGTLEFLEGKESGMSGDCLPDALIQDIPHFYAYYVGNPSEAMIAKRRSHATLIGYQSPPFTVAGLYGEYASLEALLHQYREAEQLHPSRLPDLWKMLQDQAAALFLEASSLESLESELYRIRRSMIPDGLHILGEGYTHEQAAQHMSMVLGHERGTYGSLQRLYARSMGWDYDELLEAQDIRRLQTLDEYVEKAVLTFVQTRKVPDPPQGSADQQSQWQDIWELGLKAYQSTKADLELTNLLRAMDGKYMPVSLAGDCIRNPEVLPSGNNLVQFDPRSIPSRAAVASGWRIAENTLNLYDAAHNSYPETTALVMWGLETSRTQGETLGQILAYLGVRAKDQDHHKQVEYEIIPLSELRRPRLNVLVHICGFFRDMFPEQLSMLHRLFKEISELEEPVYQNRFKKHSKRLYQQLRSAGAEHDEAWDLACARIYGPAAGEYGTSVTKLIETKQWEEEDQLGAAFMNSLKYVYSSDYRGKDMYDLYAANLAAVDIVSQIRSNHEHEITDLDHYYEFFGGLAKSVEITKGGKAEIYISDTTREQILTEEVRNSVLRGVRTRLLNPKWIDGLLKHDYHGAQKAADRVENLLGLAATTNQVDSWIFSAVHHEYVANEQRSKQMSENNSWAYSGMLETLLESHQRNYWKATEEELNMLRDRFLELEGELEGPHD